ncbi:MAG: molybdate ABC transporter substrate-binding protein [Oceanicoccus sp.]|uniref:molybdate ABC transporter substrate-binding protein n=1 Tax=Oceanicoccus sp. TaxID=2691044 RepID=UPI00260E2A1C|nr:molybdate ABC transporter substrate-binding protein [Oceanicoccus sp.]MDG1773011.1 molybdate ABC transporter substrate-binding protein [Oceanicoccus sp.]
MQKLLIVISLSLAITHAAYADSATIAVATNFKTAMTQLIAQFHQQYPQHQIKQSNASSGSIVNQVQQGAPFTAFLSADSRYPQSLESQGLAIANTRTTYAEGQLVVVAPGQIISDPQTLSKAIKATIEQQHKIAIANPAIAPYGMAAQQSLNHLKLWQSAQAHLVKGSNVGQTFQYVATGNAPIAFVALSQVKHLNPAMAYWPIPQDWYQPIRQQAILLQSGQTNQAAIQFLAFLHTEPAKATIRQQGYRI